jgi:hypothetical protein
MAMIFALRDDATRQSPGQDDPPPRSALRPMILHVIRSSHGASALRDGIIVAMEKDKRINGRFEPDRDLGRILYIVLSVIAHATAAFVAGIMLNIILSK